MKAHTLLTLAVLSTPAWAGTLFQEKEVEFTLNFPYEDLIEDRDTEYRSASINLKEKELPGLVKRRNGNKDTYCGFPHLQLKADKSLAKNTLFEGVRAVKLKTHCAPLSGSSTPTSNYGTEKELRLEYFAREAYKELSVLSFNTVLATINYQSFDFQFSQQEKALIYENEKDVIARAGGREIKEADDPYGNDEKTREYFGKLRSKFNQDSLAMFYLFQSFLVNDSWQLCGLKESTTFSKNTFVVESSNGKWEPVAFDFNRSQLVGESLDADYMISLQKLMIEERPRTIAPQSWERAKKLFKEKKEDLKKIVRRTTNEGSHTRLIKIIDKFASAL